MRNALIQNIYPLTPMQEGLLYHSILDEHSEAYFDQTVITLNERLNAETLKESFQTLIDRYDVLRTVFVYKETDQPLQVVLANKEATIDYRDITELNEAEQRLYVDNFTINDRKMRFDLEKDLLIRISVLALSDTSCKMVLSFHHIIMDGWCIGTIAKDLFQIYRAYSIKQKPELDAVFPYSRYISWLGQQNKKTALAYWEQQLSGVEEQSGLPLSSKSTEDGSYKLNNHIFTLDEQLTRGLEMIAQQNQVTLSSVFHGIWGLLLQRYNDTKDVVFGSVVSGRPAELEGSEKMVGLFINTIPVRICHKEAQTFSQIIKQFQQNMMESGKYHFLSLADIQMLTPLGKNLIHHIIAFENYPITEELAGGEGEQLVSIVETEGFEQTNYDFNIGVIPGKELKVKFGYNSIAYQASDIQRIELHLKQIAEQVVSNPHMDVDDIDLLSGEEKHRILRDFNDTDALYPQSQTIQQLFEEQAALTPNRLAAAFADGRLTYLELNERANRLARVLRMKGVQTGQIVGIAAYRSPEMLVGIMAILKAGGAYLPINPEDPLERIQYIAGNSGASILLVQQEIQSTLKDLSQNISVLAIGADWATEKTNLEPYSGPEDVAYVIYTSGSTGKPKGVMIRHTSIVNRLHWMQKKYPIGVGDIILQKTPYTFDVSVWELFWWAIAGASVYFLPPDGEKDPKLLVNTVAEQKITTLHFVPSMLSVFLEYVEQHQAEGKLSSIKRVFASGEALTVKQARRFNTLLRKPNGTTLHNLYGPTEATVDATWFDCPDGDDLQSIPIGKPIDNNRLYILDQEGRLLPVGIPGELYIAGTGVAQGYINQPDLTDERFTDSPFVIGERMYKTGDLAKWLPDGNVEYLGRTDHQVKIRGYRIETGEIEKVLLSHHDIREAVVLSRKDQEDETYLCAYIVSDRELLTQEIRSYLKASLPLYMVPAHLIQIAAIPLTTNGKVNRGALPEPHHVIREQGFVAPRTDTETRLVRLWEDILHVSPIGVHSHFFELGGHSLKATILIGKIIREFQVELPMREIFEYPTVESMSKLIERTIGRGAGTFTEIALLSGQTYYPVSSSQRRQMILHQLEGAELVYNMPSVMLVQGHLDQERLKMAFTTLIHRHEALRTSFSWINGEPVQSVHDEVEFELKIHSLTSKEDIEEQQIETVLSEFVQPFDLSRAPLLRGELIPLTENQNMLLVDLHHIISDGVSMSIIMDEFVKSYDGQALPPLSVQYKDYASWHNEQVNHGFIKDQESYWLDIFKNEPPVLELPTDFPRPSIQSYEGNTVSRILGDDITEPLHKLAAETQSTLFMILLAVYNVVLSKHARQDDIVIGTPVAGRRHPDTEKIVGMFVNTLALRTSPSSEKSLSAFLDEVKEAVLSAFEHQEYPFEQLVEKLALRRDVSRSPIFDTMFVMQNTKGQPLQSSGLEFKPFPFNPGVSRFDLTLSAEETGSYLHLNLEYNSALFQKDTVERFLDHMVVVLRSFVAHSTQTIGDTDLLTTVEKEVILKKFNGTAVPYPREKTIHQLFEEQVERTPEHPAALYQDRQLTYRELNAQANRVAHVLRKKGIGPDQMVGIAVHRSLEMIVGLLGILKAGGAYLPLHPEDPEERLGFMLEDSGASILLTQRDQLDRLRPHGADRELIAIEDLLVEGMELTGEECEKNPEPVNHSSDLVYVIYTSGSTGKPKGVMIEHASLINRLHWMEQRIPFGAEDVILQKTPYTFDVSLWELFSWAIQGATVCFLEPGGEKDPATIAETVEANGVTAIHFVPSMLGAFLEYIEHSGAAGKMRSVRRVFASGEALMTEHVRRFNRLLGAEGATLHNLYGPTEATVEVAYYDCPAEQEPESIPIGKPIDNVKLYILDHKDRLQPIGVPGELHIGGDCVARGYVNRKELTEEKFVADPYAAGGRMYRTGDLARWLPDGNIEYMGRIDHQVKIRGYRIELGEIEAAILAYEGVQTAVVLARDDRSGGSYLCAYVEHAQEFNIQALKARIKEVLPEYMVPAYIVSMEAMPYLSSGKIDRKALPEPDHSLSIEVDYISPSNEVEALMAEIWQEVLGYAPIGTNHNFFELGGDSIKAIQISTRLSKHGYRMEIKDLFRHQTIGSLTPDLRAVSVQAEQGIIEGEAELSPIQRWFFEQKFTESNYWNQAVMLYSQKGWKEELVDQVLCKLTEHHDALRMTYTASPDRITPVIHGTNRKAYALTVLDVSHEASIEEAIHSLSEAIQRRMNLEEGPLVQAGLFHTAQGDHLLLAIHHLVVDGVSWRILLEDLEQGYMQALNNEEILFQAKTHSWKDWTHRLGDDAKGARPARYKRYWENVIRHASKPLHKDYPVADRRGKDLKICSVRLSKQQTDRLQKDVHKVYSTNVNDLLLTAFGLALRDWTDNDEFTILLEGHGREQIFDDIDITRTVGWFTTMYPIHLDMKHNADLAYQIKLTKEALRRVPNKGIDFGILEYMTLHDLKSTNQGHFAPEIRFNYHGQIDSGSVAPLFVESKYSPGRTVSEETETPFVLDINGSIEQGILTLEIEYSSREYAESSIQKLGNFLQSRLLEIIEHCSEKKEKEWTPADVSDDENLSINDLDEIMAYYKNNTSS
ncbi:amino acid adenylation domain-containing protein [Paenibacillus polymyxa]|uniref:amino acid adenylation domain-containing protein n=1 Tax=Paenibacillus polymyxa TaxID=1406 RepID=UPI002ED555C6|nr:amino acid adenylation domain-containing protein [Paenibacillus polymyxa]